MTKIAVNPSHVPDHLCHPVERPSPGGGEEAEEKEENERERATHLLSGYIRDHHKLRPFY